MRFKKTLGIIATIATISTFTSMNNGGTKVNADDDNGFRNTGVFTENLNRDGSENPHEKNFAQKASDEINKHVNSKSIDSATEKVKDSLSKENLDKAKDKIAYVNGSDQATELKEKASKGISGLWNKAKSIFSGGKSEANSTSKKDNSELSNLEYASGSAPILSVNGGKSDLNIADWHSSKISYSDLDNENRVGMATAYLGKSNVGKSEGRGSQTWEPTGWKNQAKVVNGKRVNPFDRGHLIAYTLSFNFDNNGNYISGQTGSENNPKNLSTQTRYTNRTLFQRYEGEVRNELKNGGKVIYQVTPIFRDNEKMPRGFHLQAVSDDNKLNFNVYIFNVMSGLKFNYADGSSVVDNSMIAK